ncbi:hypothetical protein ACIOHB_36250 [Streptomyces microflavus]|uniref:hypothetical protein n=1 Tax=Streptomyces microflavus TaxID=1919 RepID=UPI0037FA3814
MAAVFRLARGWSAAVGAPAHTLHLDGLGHLGRRAAGLRDVRKALQVALTNPDDSNAFQTQDEERRRLAGAVREKELRVPGEEAAAGGGCVGVPDLRHHRPPRPR